MISIKVNWKDYVIGAMGVLYRIERRDIGNVQVPVRKGSREAARVYAALDARRTA